MPRISARGWKAGWHGTTTDMAVTLDILRAWRDPKGLIRDKLGAGRREDRALAVAMGACFLIFVAQWPKLSRDAFLQPEVPLEARLGASLLGILFLLPLMLYALGLLSHLVAKAIGGKGSNFGARLALFWAMLGVAPLMLFQGLLAGFLGQGVQVTTVGVIVGVGFLYLWLNMLVEAEREC